MIETLEQLSYEIEKYLDIDIKLKDLTFIVDNYIGNDWIKYEKFCNFGYKRNLVFRNNRFEILILCWNPTQKSQIHDHPQNGCLVKVLKGQIKEETFAKINNNFESTGINYLGKNDISYQEGECGLHSIENFTDNCTTTLHIYAPSNYQPNFYKN